MYWKQRSCLRWTEDMEQVKGSAISFFKGFLSSNGDGSKNHRTTTREVIPHMINREVNRDLCALLTLGGVKEAVFSMDQGAVAGPDGCLSRFLARLLFSYLKKMSHMGGVTIDQFLSAM
ncbi:hypothetical protein LIER_25104 [Lithospermum erythrorhizon]|uniref:Reverse transcriptase n=1 Tax=Lithospermum erythrorhizon TaxID=34254 RepID=A0AAV3R3I4_LITER